MPCQETFLNVHLLKTSKLLFYMEFGCNSGCLSKLSTTAIVVVLCLQCLCFLVYNTKSLEILYFAPQSCTSFGCKSLVSKHCPLVWHIAIKRCAINIFNNSHMIDAFMYRSHAVAAARGPYKKRRV